VADVATALAPIGAELRRQVTAASYLQTDDTPVTIRRIVETLHPNVDAEGVVLYERP
jgi:hypothetical protein